MIKPSVIKELQSVAGKAHVFTTGEMRKAYSYDSTTNWFSEPEAVIFPDSVEETSKIMAIANRERIPVTPRGGGTNVSGGSIPIQGGIVLCMTRMNRILAISTENQTAVVEPGLILMDFNTSLGREGFFFPPDPQSFYGATMGGIIAENAGGPSCLKYGVTNQYVLGLEVVLPTGQIVHTGGPIMRSIGYDLTMLFVGSEGTLGIVTKASLKINRLPPSRKTIVAVYDNVVVAGENVSRILEEGIIPYKIELLDNWIIKSIEQMTPLGLPTYADAVLLFEVEGIPEAVETQAEMIAKIAVRSGAVEVRIAKDIEDGNKYWLARRAGFAGTTSRARTIFAEDVVVPRNELPRLISTCREIAKQYGVQIVLLGHAGDGNLHPTILTDDTDREHYRRALEALDALMASAVELGGVLSGEHGIGLEKKKYFMETSDPVVIKLMKDVKEIFDPNNIMNPGKIWN